MPVHDGDGDDGFEMFEFADDEGAVSPGAGVGDEEVVAVFGWGMRGTGGRGYVGAEGGDLAVELAVFGVRLDPVGDFAGRSFGFVGFVFLKVRLALGIRL